jgi:carboxyl-terminal processing protease
VVGVRSFGKGLVQQQHTLNDGSAVRVVVSRYFTPSGRCIQKPFEGKTSEDYEAEVARRYETGEMYDPSKVEVADSLKFKTMRSGRTVYGGGGVMPDIFVADDTTEYSQYLFKLSNSGLIRDFGTYYYDRNPQIKKQFANGFAFAANYKLQPAALEEFVEFAKAKGVAYVDADFKKSTGILTNLVKAQIGHAAFGDEATRPVLLQRDRQFQKALEVIPQAKELEKTGTFGNR